MATATSIVPYQPAPGLPVRDALARAHDYIDRLTKKHEALHKAKEALFTGAKRAGNTFILSSCTATTAAGLAHSTAASVVRRASSRSGASRSTRASRFSGTSVGSRCRSPTAVIPARRSSSCSPRSHTLSATQDSRRASTVSATNSASKRRSARRPVPQVPRPRTPPAGLKAARSTRLRTRSERTHRRARAGALVRLHVPRPVRIDERQNVS